MKWRRWFAVILALCLQDAATAALEREQVAGPAHLQLRTQAPADTLALSDTLTLTVTVDGSSQLEATAQLAVDGRSNWTILERDAEARAMIEPNRVRWQQRFVLAPQAPGSLTLPLPVVRYRDHGRDWQQAAWQPIVIPVVTTVAADPAHLRERTRIEELPVTEPSSSSWRLPLLIVAPCVVGGGAALYCYRRRRRGPRRRASEVAALRYLERLAASDLPESGRGERFVSLLSIIVRRYLQQRFGLPARRRTTADVVQLLTVSGACSEEQIKRLRSFLEACDLIKFTRETPQSPECRALWETARHFIEDL